MDLAAAFAALRDPRHVAQLDFLLGIPKFGKDLGLQRMEAIQAALPAHDWSTIKITGSNGKGSTAVIIDHILQEMGYRTGRYTSPHLFYFGERICTNGSPISIDGIEQGIRWIQEYLSSQSNAQDYGAFEVFTALALHHFATEGIPHVICEVGIGGRLDSTRVVPGQLIGLTSLDLEHTKLLGTSIMDIAREKIDLCPPGGKVILGCLNKNLPMDDILEYIVSKKRSYLLTEEETEILEEKVINQQTLLDIRVQDWILRDIRQPLTGKHQTQNLRLALLTTHEYLKSKNIPQRPQKLDLEALKWPGRCQVLSKDPLILVDLAHTPRAMEAFAGAVRSYSHKKAILLTGVSNDKDPIKLLKPILPQVDTIICTQATHRAMPATDLFSRLGNELPQSIIRDEPHMQTALEEGVHLAREQNRPLLITGGLFSSTELMATHAGYPANELRWF